MTTATQTKPKTAALCLCGCGDTVRPNRDFRQGHDQRLVSLLAQDLVEGDGVILGFSALPEAWTPADLQARIEQARRLVADKFSAGLADKFESAAKNRAKKARGRVAKTPPQVTDEDESRSDGALEDQSGRGLTPDEMLGGPQLGAPIRFKIGKRPKVYQGQVSGMNQAGKVTAVTYRNGSGNEQSSTNFILVTE